MMMARKREKGGSGRLDFDSIMTDAGVSPNDDLPHGYLSPTQISMYLRCGMQYFFRYVEGLKEPPAVAKLEGGAYHAAMEVNNRERRKTGRNISLSDAVEVFADRFSKQSGDIEDWEGDTYDSVVGRHKTLLRQYLNEVAPMVEIGADDAVEQGFAVEVDGIPIVGVIDLEAVVRPWEKRGKPIKRLFDYKVSGRKMATSDLEQSIQMTAYAMYKRNRRVGVIWVQRKVGGRVEPVLAQVPAVAERILRYQVCSVAAGISAGVFPPSDCGGWQCSPKYCGYWHRCRGASAKTIILPE